MKSKYSGSIDKLKELVAACDLTGEWAENTKHRFHSFHAESGEVLNWWPGTGTVQFQGENSDAFRALFGRCERKAKIAARPKFATTLPG